MALTCLRIFCSALAAFCALVMLPGPVLANDHAPTGKRPNFIIILADDLGYADVGFQGAVDFDTPNIDRLASEGMHFTQAYISHPYCSPSRAGLLTGRYQAHFGHEYNPPDLAEGPENDRIGTDLGETFLAQALRDQGYATVAIGKWHLGSAPQYLPHNRGFDLFYGFAGGSRGYWPDPQADLGKRMQLNGAIQPEDKRKYLTDDLTDFAIDYVGKARDKPFFMYLAYNAPHAPDHAPAQDLAKTDQIFSPGRSTYAAMIVGMDRNIGRLMEALEKQGIRKDTMIVFLSDNGGRPAVSDNRPLRGIKGSLYEGGIRTPFIVNQPGVIAPGTSSDAPVIALDLFPTLMERAGGAYRAKRALDGRSLWPLLLRPGAGLARDTLYWRALDGGAYAIRQGPWKLVKGAYLATPELFNLADDPRESEDVSAKFPDRAAALQTAWEAWNRSGKATAWVDDHEEHEIEAYCEWRDRRASALSPAERAAARCADDLRAKGKPVRFKD